MLTTTDTGDAPSQSAVAGNLAVGPGFRAGRLIGLFLLTASFVRRLRDAGLPALIAIVPVLATLIAAYASVAGVEQMQQLMLSGDIQAMDEAATKPGLGLVAYVGYLVVIVCGVLPSRNAH